MTHCAKAQTYVEGNVFFPNNGHWLKKFSKNPFDSCPHPLRGTVQNATHFVSPRVTPDKKNIGGVMISISRVLANKFNFEIAFKKTPPSRYNSTTKQWNKGMEGDVSFLHRSLEMKMLKKNRNFCQWDLREI